MYKRLFALFAIALAGLWWLGWMMTKYIEIPG